MIGILDALKCERLLTIILSMDCAHFLDHLSYILDKFLVTIVPTKVFLFDKNLREPRQVRTSNYYQE